MAAYAVEFDERAFRDLKNLSRDVALRIGRRLAELKENPQPRGNTIKRLHGFRKASYRFRVGDYRAVYEIRAKKVVILRVIHRRELERALQDLF